MFSFAHQLTNLPNLNSDTPDPLQLAHGLLQTGARDLGGMRMEHVGRTGQLHLQARLRGCRTPRKDVQHHRRAVLHHHSRHAFRRISRQRVLDARQVLAPLAEKLRTTCVTP